MFFSLKRLAMRIFLKINICLSLESHIQSEQRSKERNTVESLRKWKAKGKVSRNTLFPMSFSSSFLARDLKFCYLLYLLPGRNDEFNEANELSGEKNKENTKAILRSWAVYTQAVELNLRIELLTKLQEDKSRDQICNNHFPATLSEKN